MSVVAGPVAFAVGGLLEPAVHANGEATIAGNAAEPALGNVLHLVGFVAASFLLPVSVVGLAVLAYPKRPWGSVIGGLLGVFGWLPLAALTALEDLGYAMALRPERMTYASLYDAFSSDAVMSVFLVVYIVGHLAAYVVLGIVLMRARAVPRWAGWALILSTPVTLATFVVPGKPLVFGDVALVLIVVGSLPAARALIRRRTTESG
ncbi:hypothetical protein [Sinomonas terrae]|uniref:DUF4386 domain-containing protein n=1 Tax=Sinomonas terrae TaxID=2908838 RepID=A0ABS9U5N0_9MICC|nr:hypothetical protein [Sinomonas terrae]MCH6471979.1 hypothetical protein [Sinomonas terrae]